MSGFYVAFDRGTITLTEARQLVDELRDGVPDAGGRRRAVVVDRHVGEAAVTGPPTSGTRSVARDG